MAPTQRTSASGQWQRKRRSATGVEQPTSLSATPGTGSGAHATRHLRHPAKPGSRLGRCHSERVAASGRRSGDILCISMGFLLFKKKITRRAGGACGWGCRLVGDGDEEMSPYVRWWSRCTFKTMGPKPVDPWARRRFRLEMGTSFLLSAYQRKLLLGLSKFVVVVFFTTLRPIRSVLQKKGPVKTGTHTRSCNAIAGVAAPDRARQRRPAASPIRNFQKLNREISPFKNILAALLLLSSIYNLQKK